MIDILPTACELFVEDGYECSIDNLPYFDYLTFENPTYMGFVLNFDSPEGLIENWRSSFKELVVKHQLAFRAAKNKAWNVYLILLTSAEASSAQKVSMNYIEEDLIEARKIAVAGVGSYDNLKQALLPLLKIQTFPNLGAIDFKQELQLRLSDLPEKTFELFMSDASEEQILELLRTPQ